jgi:hypothetical protein
MPKKSPTDQIEFLVRRKFPECTELDPLQIDDLSDGGRLSVGDWEGLREKIESYAAELQKKPSATLQKLYKKELAKNQNKEHTPLEDRLTPLEKRWALHNPKNKVVYEHWSRKDYWTIDEAISLLSGKNPDLVNWDTLQMHVEDSLFASWYSEIRELVQRALHAEQLSEPLRPSDFLTWAKLKELDHPPELEEQVRAKGGTIEDWKSKYSKLKALWDQREAELCEMTKNNNELRERVMELESTAEVTTALEQPLKLKESQSLLKLVAGMAVAGYSYNPKEKRSDVTKEISDDLALRGIELHPDTVRKWLREASEILPPDTFEDNDR